MELNALLSVDEVQELIVNQAMPLTWEQVPLQEARNRVLACSVVTDLQLPPFTNSAVDGYAVHTADLQAASSQNPVVLQERGVVMAGDIADWELLPGCTARIMTGAPLPRGADAVVMVEDVITFPAAETPTAVEFTCSVTSGQHVRVAGEDIETGQVALPAGTVVRAGEIALLAAVGCIKPTVLRRPRVALFTTGDEVVEAEQGVVPQSGKLRNSNLPVMTALAADAGAEIVSVQHLPDDFDVIKAAVLRVLDGENDKPDLIVAAGGVSMGDRDYVRAVMGEIGALSVWRVAMKPGKPVAFGVKEGTLFFGLPGNPVSVQVTWEIFVRPALRRMQGFSDLYRNTVMATLDEGLRHKCGRREFIRVRLRCDDDGWHGSTTGPQGSGFLRSMVGANGMMIVDERLDDIPAGTVLPTLLLDM